MVALILQLASQTTSPQELADLLAEHLEEGRVGSNSDGASIVISHSLYSLSGYSDAVHRIAKTGKADDITLTLRRSESRDAYQIFIPSNYSATSIDISASPPIGSDPSILVNAAQTNLRLTLINTLALLSDGFSLERDGDTYRVRKGSVVVEINGYQPERIDSCLPSVRTDNLNNDFSSALSTFNGLNVLYNLELKLTKI